jgi:putative membrane protein
MSLQSFFQKDSFPSNTSRGIISGFIGGLAGSAVKSVVERFLEVRKIDNRSAQIKVMDQFSTKITGSPIKLQNEAIVEQLVNIPLGATVGAIYGYGKRDKDEVNIVDGGILGATTWASTHETSLPLMGLDKSPKKVPVKTQVHELVAHVIFGITTEVVRGYVNDKLRSKEEESEEAEFTSLS